MEQSEELSGVAMPEAVSETLQGQSVGDGATRDGYAMAWLLWRERRFIARLTGIGIVAGIVLALLIPSRYAAKAQLMPPDATGGGAMSAIAAGVADKAGGLGTAAADLLGFKSSGALFVGILKSRTVQDRLVDRFDLRKVYGVKYWLEARRELADRTEVTEDRKSGLISIEVSDRNRDRARQMAQAYVDELNRVVSTSAMSTAAREREFIEQQMADVKKEMDESARALAQFSTTNNTIDLKEQAHAMVDAVATVQGQMIAAEAELKGLQSIYTDSNIRVRSARAKITELNRQLLELSGKAGDTKTRVSGDYPTIRQLPNLGVTYEDLYRRNRIAIAVYEALVQQFEMSKMQEAKDTPQVQMLDVPERPEIKAYPPRSLIVLGCTLLSLCFAAGWVLAYDQWESVDAGNPGKLLLYEITGAVRSHPFWRSGRVLQVRAISGRAAQAFKRIMRARGNATPADVRPEQAD